MKIRNGYVSNSSSSSFVINNFNKEKIVKLIDEFIKTIDFDSDDNEPFYSCEEDVKKCILNKINEKNKKEQYFNIYIVNHFYHIFSLVFDSFDSKRNWDLSKCKKCTYYPYFKSNICNDCFYQYIYNEYLEYEKEYLFYMSDFKYFDFRKDIDKIKEFVYKLNTKTVNGEIIIDKDFKTCSDIIMNLAKKYSDEWKKLNPNFHVLSFSSNDGDDTEALMRYNICDFVDFMKNNGIEGFKGENS